MAALRIRADDLVLTRVLGDGDWFDLFTFVGSFCVGELASERIEDPGLLSGNFGTGGSETRSVVRGFLTLARNVLGNGLCGSFGVANLENDRVIGRLGGTSIATPELRLHETEGFGLGSSGGGGLGSKLRSVLKSSPLGNVTFDSVSSRADPEPLLEPLFGLAPTNPEIAA